MRIKKKLGMLKNLPKSDDLLEDDIYPRYLERLKSDIEKARCEADYVIVCLHSGGLFNVKVGAYTEYIVDLIVRLGADIKIKCLGCGNIIMLERNDFNSKVKKILKK